METTLVFITKYYYNIFIKISIHYHSTIMAMMSISKAILDCNYLPSHGQL